MTLYNSIILIMHGLIVNLFLYGIIHKCINLVLIFKTNFHRKFFLDYNLFLFLII